METARVRECAGKSRLECFGIFLDVLPHQGDLFFCQELGFGETTARGECNGKVPERVSQVGPRRRCIDGREATPQRKGLFEDLDGFVVALQC
ncbi:hypothetical protein DMH26_01935 [Streptomyces sp. WAC 05379]|nr:hypothetical protein DMH26_01935 [Streptomyces sp. WAC 05379]